MGELKLYKLEKKLIAAFISLTFILLAATSSSAISVEKQKLNVEESVENPEISTETVTVYRCGPDGSITPVELNLELDENQDIGDAIVAQCNELLENDEEIQNLMQKSNISLGLFTRIYSKGRGFHYKTMLIEKIGLRYLLWKLQLPRIASLLAKPLIFCMYGKDLTARTVLKPLLRTNTTEKVMEGAHMVIARNFIGYTTWVGRFSITPLNIIPKAFSGYARFAFCIKL